MKYFFLTFFTVLFFQVQAQNEPFVREWPGADVFLYQGTYFYQAIDKVVLGPGVQMDAQGDMRYVAYLNDDITLDIEVGDPQDVHTFPIDQPISDDFEVGSITGGLSVDLYGALNYSIPISVSAGVSGVQPSLALSYHSSGQHMLAGKGWGLSGISSITRANKTLWQDGVVRAPFLNDDGPFMIDGQRLVETEIADVWSTENEQWIRIERTNGETPFDYENFKVTRKDGSVNYYGQTGNSRLTNPNGNFIIAWYLSRSEDKFGNYIDYEYKKFGDEVLLKEISYGGNSETSRSHIHSIDLHYSPRTNSERIVYRQGMRIQATHMLKVIQCSTNGKILTSYRLEHSQNSNEEDFLIAVHQSWGDSGSLEVNPTRFTYEDLTTPSNPFERQQTSASGQSTSEADAWDIKSTGDFNGDGITDILECRKTTYEYGIQSYDNWQVRLGQTNANFSSVFASGSLPDGFNRVFEDVVNIQIPLGVNHVSDFNGDHRDEFLLARVTPHGSTGDSRLYDLVRISFSPSGGVLEDNMNHLFISNTSANDYVIIDLKYFMIPGDANANGKPDIILSYGSFSYILELDENEEWISSPNFSFIYSDGITDIIPADFNGDGKADYLLRNDGSGSGPDVYAALTVLELNSVYNDNANEWTFSPTVLAEFDEPWCGSNWHFRPGDFNGDGYTDLLCVREQTGAEDASYSATDSKILLSDGRNMYIETPNAINPSGDVLSYELRRTNVLTSDINGDGYSDVTFISYSSNRNARLEYHMSNGHSFELEMEEVYNYDDNSPDERIYEVKDYVEGYPDFPDDYNIIDIYPRLRRQEIFGGDFNGDGTLEFIIENRLVYEDPRVQISGSFSRAEYISPNYTYDLRRMTAERDGLGRESQISYGKTAVDYSNNKTYPFRGSQARHDVVASVTSSNHRGANVVKSYSFEEPVFHLRGKGFLGYHKQSVASVVNIAPAHSTFKESYQKLNSVYEVMLPCSTRTHMWEGPGVADATNLVNESSSTWQISDLNPSQAHKRLLVAPDVTTVHDYVNHTSKRVDLWYGQTGLERSVVRNRNEKITKLNDLDNPIHTVNTDNTYDGLGDGWYNLRLKTSVTENRRAAQAPVTNTMSYDYDDYYDNDGDTHNLLSYEEVSDRDVKTSYDYTTDGLVKTTSTESPGLSSSLMSYAYHPITRKLISETDVLGRESITEYDPYSGLPVRMTNHLGQSSAVAYDDMMRTVRETDPYGAYTDYVYDWVTTTPSLATNSNLSDTGHEMYFISTSGTNRQPSTSYYSQYDQKTRSTSSNHFGIPVQVVTQYDDHGRVWRKTAPHNSSTPEFLVSETSYDLYGRTDVVQRYFNGALSSSAALDSQQMTYTYDTQYGGMKTEVEDLTGSNYSWQVSDATGTVVASADEGGILTFEHDSRGNQLEVRMGTTVLSTMTYDPLGRQMSLEDPNAGKTEYRYDAYDRITYQLDAFGNGYGMEYDDVIGQLERKVVYPKASFDSSDRLVVGPGESTSEYTFLYEQTGENIGNLLRSTPPITEGTDMYTEQTYDELTRLATRTEVIEGESFTTSYTYDEFGRLATQTMPIGVTVTNSYHPASGALDERVANDGTILWSAMYQNVLGKYTSINRGGVSNTKAYNALGQPLELQISGLQDLRMTWDMETSNLLSRSDYINGQEEQFHYDELDRLTKTKLTAINADHTITPVDWASEPCALLYASNCESATGNGNILYKADAGDYTYDFMHPTLGAIMPHAVSEVSDPQQLIANETQNISYTAFNSLREIEEDNSARLLRLTYGSDEQRRQSLYYTDGGLMYTRVHAGNYERQTIEATGVTQEVCAIGSPTGMAAVYVIEDGATGAWKFPITDHLGSILGYYDAQGALITETAVSFDAWGRQRAADDWASYLPANSTELQDVAWSWRGYTNHEHLDAFGLINMNGRCYDPLLGRMLSADNFVQSPFGTQGYNRYAYVLNNPLKYVDPDGEWVHIAIGAVVGGIINLGVKAYQGKINSVGDGLMAFGIGAVAGAVGAATGGAAFAAYGGGAAGAGGFIAGAAAGAVGAAASAPIQSIGNHLYFDDPLMTAEQYATTIATGALLGGVVNGGIAKYHGNSFLTGREPGLSPMSPIGPSEIKSYNSKYQTPNELSVPDNLSHYTPDDPRQWTTLGQSPESQVYLTNNPDLTATQARIQLNTEYTPSWRIDIHTSGSGFDLNKVELVRRVTGNLGQPYAGSGGGWELIYNGQIDLLPGQFTITWMGQ